MKELYTLKKKKSFAYEGTLESGMTIFYGENREDSLYISGTQYADLIACFKGRTVRIGAGHGKVETDSMREWIVSHIGKAGIVSYIAAILVEEGVAEKVDMTSIYFK